jgi:hypothetical protein
MKRDDKEEFCRDDDELRGDHWKDSKAVTLVSISTGCEPVENVRKWSKTEKKYAIVPAPSTVCS